MGHEHAAFRRYLKSISPCDQIVDYFKLMQSVGKPGGLWCNINRLEKFASLCDPPTRASEYPYDKRNEVLVHQVDRFLRLVHLDAHGLHIERILT